MTVPSASTRNTAVASRDAKSRARIRIRFCCAGRSDMARAYPCEPRPAEGPGVLPPAGRRAPLPHPRALRFVGSTGGAAPEASVMSPLATATRSRARERPAEVEALAEIAPVFGEE